jgi:Nucleotidyl transferase AbiEii toxin, Type IV TA system
VPCYDPRYTFVEKLQTISTKFRLQQGGSPIDFMRHYYDVHNLLKRPEVQEFIGTDAYKEHKAKRFTGGDERDLAKNQAFHLTDPATRADYEKAYNATSALYYRGKPTLDEILSEIGKWADRM